MAGTNQGQHSCQGGTPVPHRQMPVWPSQVRYRGLFKNTAQLFTLFGLSNLVQARRWLLDAKGWLRPEVWKWRRNAAKSVDYAPKWLFPIEPEKQTMGR